MRHLGGLAALEVPDTEGVLGMEGEAWRIAGLRNGTWNKSDQTCYQQKGSFEHFPESLIPST
jgi:hypothetical protein